MSYTLEICLKLSEDFEFVRVDLFEVDYKIYFSELNFSTCLGMIPFETAEYDYLIGEKIELKSS